MHRRQEELRAPISRKSQVVLGAVCLFVSIPMLALAALGLFVMAANPSGTGFVFVLILAAIGALFAVLSWRLLLGRSRADGGLFSPTGLRAGGVIFLAGPVAALFVEPIGLLHAGISLAAAVGCFALAGHREQHVTTPSSAA